MYSLLYTTVAFLILGIIQTMAKNELNNYRDRQDNK